MRLGTGGMERGAKSIGWCVKRSRCCFVVEIGSGICCNEKENARELFIWQGRLSILRTMGVKVSGSPPLLLCLVMLGFPRRCWVGYCDRRKTDTLRIMGICTLRDEGLVGFLHQRRVRGTLSRFHVYNELCPLHVCRNAHNRALRFMLPPPFCRPELRQRRISWVH